MSVVTLKRNAFDIKTSTLPQVAINHWPVEVRQPHMPSLRSRLTGVVLLLLSMVLRAAVRLTVVGVQYRKAALGKQIVVVAAILHDYLGSVPSDATEVTLPDHLASLLHLSWCAEEAAGLPAGGCLSLYCYLDSLLYGIPWHTADTAADIRRTDRTCPTAIVLVRGAVD